MLNIKNAEIERVLLTAKKNEKAREKAKYVLQELKKRYENRAIVPEDEELIRKITFKIETIQKLRRDGKKVLSDKIEAWREEVAVSIPLLALDGAGDADAAGAAAAAAEVQPPPAKKGRPSKRLR